jgi:hypothetical protein
MSRARFPLAEETNERVDVTRVRANFYGIHVRFTAESGKLLGTSSGSLRVRLAKRSAARIHGHACTCLGIFQVNQPNRRQLAFTRVNQPNRNHLVAPCRYA